MEIQANSVKKDTHGWPGTDTAFRLAIFDRKLVVSDNPVGLSVEHLINVPIKKLDIQATWLVLRGLKNNWIQLVEHHAEVAPKQNTKRTQKSTTIQSPTLKTNNHTGVVPKTKIKRKQGTKHVEDTENEEEEDEDEIISEPGNFHDNDEEEEEDDDEDEGDEDGRDEDEEVHQDA